MASGRSTAAVSAPASGADKALEPNVLPGVIGAEMSQPLSSMQGLLHDIKEARSISKTQLRTLTALVVQAQRIAQQSQQISRLAEGRLRQSHERLGLHTLLQDVLEHMTPYFQERGMEVRHNIKQVDVIVDPGLLSSLVEVAVQWAASQGQRLQISLDIKNWPEHGQLTVKASQQVATAAGNDEPPSPDTLAWHLLVQIAQAMGVSVDRIMGRDHALVVLEFPRTVKQLEGLTAVEVDAGGDSGGSYLSESKPLAGHRLLLVSADSRLRGEVKDICSMMGLILDNTPTVAQAIRFCELDKPHMILVDERLRDDRFEELREDLKRSDVNFPIVELASAPNTFEMANWMGDSISRISRDVLKAHLPSILVMELAKVT